MCNKKPYYKLKGYLVEHGIKSKDVAEMLDITNTSFNSKINRNGQDFTAEQIRQLCKIFDLDANEFFLV